MLYIQLCGISIQLGIGSQSTQKKLWNTNSGEGLKHQLLQVLIPQLKSAPPSGRVNQYNVSSHLIFFHLSVRFAGMSLLLSLLFQEVAGVTGANPSYPCGQGQGTPWMSCQLIAVPLLMVEATTQGANCTSGAILGFGILFKDTSCRSVPPQGSRDSNLPITSQPALPTELQLPLYNVMKKLNRLPVWILTFNLNNLGIGNPVKRSTHRSCFTLI